MIPDQNRTPGGTPPTRRANALPRVVLLLAGLGLVLWAAAACSPKRVGAPPPETGVADVDEGPAPPSRGMFEPHRTAPRKPAPAPRQAPPDTVTDAGLPEGAEESPSPAAPADRGRMAAALAHEQLGKPYRWGGNGPDHFDCSGLVCYVYSTLGVDLPRTSRQQASAGRHVDRGDLRPGDLVFFRINGGGIDHVGVYQGRDRFVHAPRRDSPVRTDSLGNTWWSSRYRGARRIFTVEQD